MREAIISAVIICWLASVSLFLFSSFITLRFLFRFQKIASKNSKDSKNSVDSVDSVDPERKNAKQECKSVQLMPWSIVITHCCGLPCAMLSYMLLHIACDFGFLQSDSYNSSLFMNSVFMNSVLISSYVIVIGLILANLFTMVFCAFKVCK